MDRNPRTFSTSVAALVLSATLVIAGCGGASDSGDDASSSSGGSKASINLVAYSTPQVVYDEIIPAFNKTEEGAGVTVKGSFGASGEQSRAVEAGQAADIVSFSTESDVTRLVKSGKVAKNWQDNANKGQITNSVVSFIVRPGNPKNIKTWADLIKPGVEVLTPNPFTSGAAKWNLLAAYGQASNGGKDKAAGLAYVKTLLTEHVKVQDKSGREALQNFTSGNGDVLLSYEYEAVTAQKKGEKVDLVIPDDTIQIDIHVATLKDAKPEAEAFKNYILSAPAQELFASWGYRPVNAEVLAKHKDEFPVPSGLFKIAALGGWAAADTELFDPENGAITKIENEAGVKTDK